MSELKVQIMLQAFGATSFILSLLFLVLTGVTDITMVWLSLGVASLLLDLEVEEFADGRVK